MLSCACIRACVCACVRYLRGMRACVCKVVRLCAPFVNTYIHFYLLIALFKATPTLTASCHVSAGVPTHQKFVWHDEAWCAVQVFMHKSIARASIFTYILLVHTSNYIHARCARVIRKRTLIKRIFTKHPRNFSFDHFLQIQ